MEMRVDPGDFGGVGRNRSLPKMVSGVQRFHDAVERTGGAWLFFRLEALLNVLFRAGRFPLLRFIGLWLILGAERPDG